MFSFFGEMSLKKESYRRGREGGAGGGSGRGEREGGAGGGSGRGVQLFLLSAVHSQPLRKKVNSLIL